jgi:hypothetical protein
MKPCTFFSIPKRFSIKHCQDPFYRFLVFAFKRSSAGWRRQFRINGERYSALSLRRSPRVSPCSRIYYNWTLRPLVQRCVARKIPRKLLSWSSPRSNHEILGPATGQLRRCVAIQNSRSFKLSLLLLNLVLQAGSSALHRRWQYTCSDHYT